VAIRAATSTILGGVTRDRTGASTQRGDVPPDRLLTSTIRLTRELSSAEVPTRRLPLIA